MAHEQQPHRVRCWAPFLAFSVSGVVAAVLGFAMLLVPRVTTWPFSRFHVLTYAWDMLALAVFGSGFVLIRRAKRHRVLDAGAARERDSRPPILLLRSVRDDATPLVLASWSHFPFGSNRTLEELVVDCVAEHGPVVAIGLPGETLPPLGAAREYVEHQAWQARIKELATEAQSVVILAGATEGLLWELRTLAQLKLLDRRVLVLPELSDARAVVWAALRKVLEQTECSSLPSDEDVVAKGLVMTFQQNRKAVLLTGAGRWSKAGAIRAYRDALREAALRTSRR